MKVSGRLHVPAALPPGDDPSTRFVGGWVALRVGLDALVKRNISIPVGNLLPFMHLVEQ